MNSNTPVKPPATEEELLHRVNEVAGLSLAQVAGMLGIKTPDNQKHAKGWIGQLMETCLGASAGNLSEPDFVHLGIELKTIPVGINGNPKESTYVCTVPIEKNTHTSWAQSVVKKKLNRVLWVPVEYNPEIKMEQRRIGSAILWSPRKEDEEVLQQDWNEIMDLICLGDLEKVSASMGKYLQVRPKAANSRVLTRSTDTSGAPILTLPRGFYLRASFTKTIINSLYNKDLQRDDISK